ncbi:MAG TPA: hypothetical protein PLZ40_07020 [Ferruginibacter sp.]|mgnify:CR=1 FL=1|nr:hypothetical protein [Ferruginibacter sp.]
MKNLIFFAFIISSGCCHSQKNVASTVNKETTIPACVTKLIHQFSSEEKQNPPRKIFSYTYKEKKVYYVTAPCCDNFNDLYDENCNLLGTPMVDLPEGAMEIFPTLMKPKHMSN